MTFGKVWAALVFGAGLATAQAPMITSVVNDATRDSKLCPGARALIEGPGVGLVGVTTALIGGKDAPVLGSTGQNGLFVQVPADLTPGADYPVLVSRSGVQSAPFSVTLGGTTPLLYNDVRIESGFGGTAASPLQVAPGELLNVTAACLGPTNPPFPTNSGNKFPVVTLPTALVGGQPAEVVEAFHAGQGVYVVKFRVPRNAPDGRASLTVQAVGVTSNTRDLNVSTRPIIRQVLNSASFERSSAVGAIASIAAENLGSVDQLTAFPSTEVEGIRVTFNGIPAPIYHLVPSAKQINVQVPYELPPDTPVTVQIRNRNGEGNIFTVPVFSLDPGIYRVATNRFPRNAAVLFANTAWRVMPTGMAAELGIPAGCAGRAANALCGQPATAGDLIQIYATGLGAVNPDIRTGEIPPADGKPLHHTRRTPTIRIGDADAEVLFSGLVPGIAGLYQVNVRVPGGVTPGDDVPLLLSISEGDRGYGNGATIAIR